MSIKKKEIFVLNEKEEKNKNIMLSETLLTFFLFSGMLLFLKDFSYSVWCLAAAFSVGIIVIILHWITGKSEEAEGRMKNGPVYIGNCHFCYNDYNDNARISLHGRLFSWNVECKIPNRGNPVCR